MSIAFYLLTALLAATPILATANGELAHHTVALVVTLMLVLAAMGPESEIATAMQPIKRISLAMIVPILWMAVQIAPLPFSSLVNPIWSTTATALNKPSLLGHISISPGATLRSLISYLTIASLIVSAVIITRDRYRAEVTLFVLSTVTTFMSFEVLIGQLDLFAGMIPAADTAAAAPFAAATVLAALTNAAIIARTVERHLNRSNTGGASYASLLHLLAACSGIVVAFGAMMVLAQRGLVATTGLGFAAMLFIAAVRLLRFRAWPSAILFTVIVSMAGAAVWPYLQVRGASLLGFVTHAGPDSLVVGARTLSDAPWTGNGVGTYETLARAYRDFGVNAAPPPPSAMVLIAVEWGRPALLIMAGFAAQLFFLVFRGAIKRGRDSFFSSASAAAILTMFCAGFLGTSLLDFSVQILFAALIGLGLSQSFGRTRTPED